MHACGALIHSSFYKSSFLVGQFTKSCIIVTIIITDLSENLICSYAVIITLRLLNITV